ncbi:MAG TPA: hypothetical protein VFN82_07695 [Solirubrobacterales bacterium]|nr:hypothetical protein [Solirubrobacterales bacterium]
MKLTAKPVAVPLIGSRDRDHDGSPGLAVLAEFGRAAVDVGTPDRGLDEERSDAVDTIANVLHWADSRGLETRGVLESACRHFCAERRDAESHP